MIVYAESACEQELLSRRLRALRHLFGPAVSVTVVTRSRTRFGLAAQAMALAAMMRWQRQRFPLRMPRPH